MSGYHQSPDGQHFAGPPPMYQGTYINQQGGSQYHVENQAPAKEQFSPNMIAMGSQQYPPMGTYPGSQVAVSQHQQMNAYMGQQALQQQSASRSSGMQDQYGSQMVLPPPAHQPAQKSHAHAGQTQTSRNYHPHYQSVTPPLQKGHESPQLNVQHRSLQMSPHSSLKAMQMMQPPQTSPTSAPSSSPNYPQYPVNHRPPGPYGSMPPLSRQSPTSGHAGLNNNNNYMFHQHQSAAAAAAAHVSALANGTYTGPPVSSASKQRTSTSPAGGHPSSYPSLNSFPPPQRMPSQAHQRPSAQQKAAYEAAMQLSRDASLMRRQQEMENARQYPGMQRSAVDIGKQNKSSIIQAMVSSYSTDVQQMAQQAPVGRGRGRGSRDSSVPDKGQPVDWYRQLETVRNQPPGGFQSDVEAMRAAESVQNVRQNQNTQVRQPTQQRARPPDSSASKQNHLPPSQASAHDLSTASNSSNQNHTKVSHSRMSKEDALAAIQIKQEIVEGINRSKGKDDAGKSSAKSSERPNMASSSSSQVSTARSQENSVNRIDKTNEPAKRLKQEHRPSQDSPQRESIQVTNTQQSNNRTSTGPVEIARNLPHTVERLLSERSVQVAPNLQQRPIHQPAFGQMPLGAPNVPPAQFLHPSNQPQNNAHRSMAQSAPSAREKVYSMWQSGQVVGRAPATSRGRGRGRGGRGRGAATDQAPLRPTQVGMDFRNGPPNITVPMQLAQQRVPTNSSFNRNGPYNSGPQNGIQGTNPASFSSVNQNNAERPSLQLPHQPQPSPGPNQSKAQTTAGSVPVKPSQQGVQKELPRMSTKDHFYAKLHGHKLLCLLSRDRPHVIVHQFQYECFPTSGLGTVANCIDRALRIKRWPLDHPHKSKIVTYLKNNGFIRGPGMENNLQTITLDDARRVYHFMHKIRNCSSNSCVIDLPSLNVDLEAELSPTEKRALFIKIKQEKKSADDKLYGKSSSAVDSADEAEEAAGNESDRSDQTIAYGNDASADTSAPEDSISEASDTNRVIAWDGLEPKVGGLLGTIVGQVRSYKHKGENYLVVDDLCRIVGTETFFSCVETEKIRLYTCCAEILAFLNGIHFLFPPIPSRFNSLAKEKDIGVHSSDSESTESQPEPELPRNAVVKQEVPDSVQNSGENVDKENDRGSGANLLIELPNAQETISSENTAPRRQSQNEVESGSGNSHNSQSFLNETDKISILGKRKQSSDVPVSSPKSLRMDRPSSTDLSIDTSAGSTDLRELVTERSLSQSSSTGCLQIDISNNNVDVTGEGSRPESSKSSGPDNFLMTGKNPSPRVDETEKAGDSAFVKMVNFLSEGGGSLDEPICISSPQGHSSPRVPPTDKGDNSDLVLYEGYKVKVVPKTEVMDSGYEKAADSQPSQTSSSQAPNLGRSLDDLELSTLKIWAGPEVSLKSQKSIASENRHLKLENKALREIVKRLRSQVKKITEEKEASERIQQYYEGVIQDITRSFKNGDEDSPIVIPEDD